MFEPSCKSSTYTGLEGWVSATFSHYSISCCVPFKSGNDDLLLWSLHFPIVPSGLENRLCLHRGRRDSLPWQAPALLSRPLQRPELGSEFRRLDNVGSHDRQVLMSWFPVYQVSCITGSTEISKKCLHNCKLRFFWHTCMLFIPFKFSFVWVLDPLYQVFLLWRLTHCKYLAYMSINLL